MYMFQVPSEVPGMGTQQDILEPCAQEKSHSVQSPTAPTEIRFERNTPTRVRSSRKPSKTNGRPKHG